MGSIASRSSLPHAMSPHTTSAGPQVPSYGIRAVARATIRHQNDPNVHGTHLEGHFGDSPHAAKMTGSHSCAKGIQDLQKGRNASPSNMQRMHAMPRGAVAACVSARHASYTAMRCARFARSGARMGFIASRSSLPHAMSAHATSTGLQVAPRGMRARSKPRLGTKTTQMWPTRTSEAILTTRRMHQR